MFKSLHRHLAAVLLGASCLLVAAPASAVTYANTPGSPISTFGAPDTTTYGQVFSLPTPHTLVNWAFYTTSGNAGNIRFVVANWDGSRAVGPALYTVDGSSPGGAATLSFAGINLDLPAGNYVAYVTVAGVAAPVSNTAFRGSASNGGLAGGFRFLNSKGVDPLTLPTAWNSYSVQHMQYSANLTSNATLQQNLACAQTGIAAVSSASATVVAERNVIAVLVNNVSLYRTSYPSLAQTSLNQAILRTDGCALRGSVDTVASQDATGSDFIPSCALQGPVYVCLKDAQAQMTAP